MPPEGRCDPIAGCGCHERGRGIPSLPGIPLRGPLVRRSEAPHSKALQNNGQISAPQIVQSGLCELTQASE